MLFFYTISGLNTTFVNISKIGDQRFQERVNEMALWKPVFIFVLIAAVFIEAPVAFAEMQRFEKEVVETVGSDQSIEQVEAFALQKAKRLAVEEAGTYISSLTVVKNYQLEKDEITALASGVVQAKIVDVPTRFSKNNIFHVRVKAVIQVDTSVLDSQIAEIMKEKETLKKLEAERKKNRELEEKLQNLKSTELKRLEELNAQAISLEREREKRRLEIEQASLKARGELKKAQVERLQKEREMQARIDQLLAEQARAREAEAAALTQEQDQLKRAQLENEQRWNELIRKSKLSQEQWSVIDESLSLQQAMAEAGQMKKEIAGLKQNMRFEYGETVKNLEKSFDRQIAMSTPNLPPEPQERDIFETQGEYQTRLSDYQRRASEAKWKSLEVVEKLQAEKELRLIQAAIHYLENKARVLAPFIKRLKELAARKFMLPEGGMTVVMAEPEADNFRFPLDLGYKRKKWKVYWTYRDRDQARDIWNTRTYLKADGLFQIVEAGDGVNCQMTGCRVSHLGTGDAREFELVRPASFSEVNDLDDGSGAIAGLRVKEKWAELAFNNPECFIEVNRDGQYILYRSGIVHDAKTGLDWLAGPDRDTTWTDAKAWVKGLGGCGGEWRMPSRIELEGLYRRGRGERNMTPLLKTTGWCVWSGESRDSASAWNFYYRGGHEVWHSLSYSVPKRAFAVRSRK